jgi:signal transduction histidine kinase
LETVELVKLCGNFGVGIVCVSALIFIHIYNVKITMPDLQKASDARQDKLVEAFKLQMEEERKICREDHKEIRLAVVENQLALVQLLERS